MIKPFLVALACIFSGSVLGAPASEIQTEKYFEAIKQNQTKLAEFLYAMPKGGDLHTHQGGASYAEKMMQYASTDNLCVDRQTLTVSHDSTCTPENLLNHVLMNESYKNKMIDAWSMRNFVSGKQTGHDHFFATFGKYDLITNDHRGEMLAEIANRAALQNESYLELMITADNNASGHLGKQLGYDADFAKMREKLLAAPAFKKIVDDIYLSLKQDTLKMADILACGTPNAKAGCFIKIRYLYQVLREQAPEMVFAQLLAGFEAASQKIPDNHVVGINIVQAEDGRISMRDYALHMKMIGFLHQLYPAVHISLHAGELTSALVSEQGLRFHINDAVKVAKANRIGHGVDIVNETDYPALLMQMANQHTMVEINLTSNAGILNVEGKNHPLPLYLHYDVPLSLSTDDEGVNRSDLSKEYQLAVNSFPLTYVILKTFARNSLTYSFMQGDSLWADDHYQQLNAACQRDIPGSDKISSSCRHFLDGSEKGCLQWDLEKRFNEFENTIQRTR